MWRSVRRNLPMRCVALLCALALLVPLGTLSAFAESGVPLSVTGVAYVHNWNGLDVWGFPATTGLHVEVDDPETTESPDHTLDLLTDANGDLWIDLDFEVLPGFTITATAGATTRTLLVTYVEVTEVDLATSVAWGMAEPFADVISRVYLQGGATTRTTTADVDGVWSVDYSIAQGDQAAHEIVPGDMISGIIEDEHGNQSAHLFWVPDPHFNVNREWNDIWGAEWLPDTELTVTIGDPSNPDFEDTAHTDEGGYFAFLGIDYDIVAGDLVTVSDANTTKDHEVGPIEVLGADQITDRVWGTARPGSEVRVEFWFWSDNYRIVIADPVTGEWEVDFSVPGPDEGQDAEGLVPGRRGGASEYDDDGDATVATWSIPDPYFYVDREDDGIWGHGWPADAELDVSIDGSAGHAEYAVSANQWGDFDPWDLAGYDIVAGDMVTVTDGETVKEHIVTSITVTAVDIVNDIVRGTAQPGAAVWVHAEDWPVYSHREVDADAVTGEWVADFSVVDGSDPGEQPFDIGPDTQGNASERDEDGDATFVRWHAASPPVIEVEGASRYATAVQASIEAYPAGLDPAGERAVVIATGRNWPDALGGSSLAGALDGPILLVSAVVPEVVLAELDRLGAEKVYIVGGEAAVPASIKTALETAGLTVERVWGTDRYRTADAVAAKTIEILQTGEGYDGTAFVATGGSYADAVAAAPLAASQGWPLFLAHPTSGVRANSIAGMGDVTDVLILGGTGAVSAPVQSALASALDPAVTIERLAGENRYDTAAVIAKYGVDHAGLMWNRVGIATGQSYPDALAGGVLQGKMGSVMLLSRTASLPADTQNALVANRDAISTVTFFGGTGAVSQTVRDAVLAAVE